MKNEANKTKKEFLHVKKIFFENVGWHAQASFSKGDDDAPKYITADEIERPNKVYTTEERQNVRA